MSQYTFKQILRYRFDNFMAKGGRSIFISLTLVFLSLLGLISLIRGAMLLTIPDGQDAAAYLEREDPGFLNNVYITFLQMTDPGNMNQDVKSRPLFKISAILAGLSGVIMLSSLIAFITNALDQKLLELKKGHSKVVESGHTLILGWNERVIEILRELVLANESEDDPSAVILSNEDKETMDDYLGIHLRNRLNTRVVTRSGSPSSLVNLDIVSVDACKSVIVLATCTNEATDAQKQASDAMVIKTVLAVVASHAGDGEFSIVAEVFDERNRTIVEGVSDGITTIDSNDILSKILVQTSRSVGLSVVYSEILSFDGCEMYFHHDDWGGLTFGHLGFHFPDGVPMGLRHADGRILINPPIDTVLRDDDDILILAEDDSTIDFQSAPVASAREFDLSDERLEQTVERELIIGWTPKVEIILEQYADYVLEGSSVDIMLRAPDDSVRGELERIQKDLPGLKIDLIEEDPLTTEGLLAVRPFQYDNILILSQPGNGASEEQTDSETIVILLLLRNIFRAFPDESGRTKLITEVLDSDNQGLVAQSGVHDFVISNRYVSMMLAQVSEDIAIKYVYDDLFQEDGCEIYLKPASYYFTEFPVEVTFADVMRIAQKREEIALGIKIKSLERDMNANFGVNLIPEKTSKHVLNRQDSIVVVAEDET